MEKHFFAGNNTAAGFYSYFDYIVNPEKADRIYILKGGPGVGKSSFMKKMVRFLKGKSNGIEYFHCSTDSNSLDGIYLVKHKLAVVDGTAPHAIEPKFPGLVDEIIDLGKYLDRDILDKDRKEIIEINQEKLNCYKSGYRYFKMAGIIRDEIDNIYTGIIKDDKRYLLDMELMSDLDKLLSKVKPGNKVGKLRKMFVDSFTPNGYISYIGDLSKGKKVWEIICPNTSHIAELLDRIVSNVIIKGFNVEGYYSPLFPEKLQHIYIKELDLMIISSSEKVDHDPEKIYRLNECIYQEKLAACSEELETSKKLLSSLLSKGMNKFQEGKSKHEILEKIYVKAMDFNKVDLLYEEIIINYKN